MKWAIVTLISIFICLTAYRMIGWDEHGNLLAHSYAVWGDWSAHFTFISSIKERGLSFISGDNPIFHGTPFRYPFLSHLLTAIWGAITLTDTVEATLYSTLGLLFALPFVLFRFYTSLGLNNRQSILSLILFVFMGGIQIFDTELSSNDALTNQFNSGSILTQFILFELIPQRAFLFGMTLFLGTLTYIVNKIQKKQSNTGKVKSTFQFLGCAVLLSLLSWMHIHSWFAMGMLLAITVLTSLATMIGLSRIKKYTVNFAQNGLSKNKKTKEAEIFTSEKELTRRKKIDSHQTGFFRSLGSFQPLILMRPLELLGFSMVILTLSAPLLYFLLIRGYSPIEYVASWKIWAPGWAQHQSANIPAAQDMNLFLFWFYNSGLFFPFVFLGAYTWIKCGKYDVGAPNTSHPNLKYQSNPRLGGTSIPPSDLTSMSPEPEPPEATESTTGSSQIATSPLSAPAYLNTIQSGPEKSVGKTSFTDFFGFFKDKNSYQSIPSTPDLSCFNEFILITSLTGVSLFAVSILFQFQPYFYDNLKIFTYSFLFLAPLASIGIDSFFIKNSSIYSKKTETRDKTAEIPQTNTDQNSPSSIGKNLLSPNSGSIKKSILYFQSFYSSILEKIKTSPKQFLLTSVGIILIATQSSSAIHDYFFYLNQRQTTEFLTREEFEISRKFNSIRKSADSLVLINPKHNHWVTTLSGSPVLIGYQGWLWSWGIAYSTREKEAAAILLGTPWAESIIAKYPIQYIVVNEQERIANRPIDLQFLKSRFKLELKHGNWYVFNTSHSPNHN